MIGLKFSEFGKTILHFRLLMVLGLKLREVIQNKSAGVHPSWSRGMKVETCVQMLRLAFGSNIELRIKFITDTLQEMKKSVHTHILSTNFLYEPQPMYYADKSKLYNGVVKIKTSLNPVPLLEWLKEIEHIIGEEKEFFIE